MKLNHVDINNFRSVEFANISFDPHCRVLVGINESGKTNILKALSSLSEEYVPNKKDDMREALPDEKPLGKSNIMFYFDLEKDDINDLYDLVNEGILTTKENPEIVIELSKCLTIKDFCNSCKEGLYDVDIMNETKTSKYWDFGNKYKICEGWKKPSDACPKDYVVNNNGQDRILSDFKLIRISDFDDIPSDYVLDAEASDFTSYVGKRLTNIVGLSLPRVLFWTYNEENLLPSSIDIQEFAKDPEICPPLKNMFFLAGITNIKESIEDARKGSDNQFRNYLDSIAKKTTKHFISVWKDYKGLSFSLNLNGGLINPGIKEKNVHDFKRRSDGFKRFITFLLMISVGVLTEDIQNTLLLIDEPDNGLHPSGSRYLRDELIKISRNNYVVYSTHSIFMIDVGDVSRHYLVKKKDEISSIEQAGNSNISDEEVIYNALGYSVFSILKNNNIIFEGWNDKHLFQTYTEGNAKYKKKFSDVSVCHSKGASNIKTLTPMIELAKRECLIISDSDGPAKDEQKAYKSGKGYGKWKTYQDINSDTKAITGEDFIKNECLAKQVGIAVKSFGFPKFDVNILPKKIGKLAVIRTWLVSNGLNNVQSLDIIKQIKGLIFSKLNFSDIDDEYGEMIDNIKF